MRFDVMNFRCGRVWFVSLTVGRAAKIVVSANFCFDGEGGAKVWKVEIVGFCGRGVGKK